MQSSKGSVKCLALRVKSKLLFLFSERTWSASRQGQTKVNDEQCRVLIFIHDSSEFDQFWSWNGHGNSILYLCFSCSYCMKLNVFKRHIEVNHFSELILFISSVPKPFEHHVKSLTSFKFPASYFIRFLAGFEHKNTACVTDLMISTKEETLNVTLLRILDLTHNSFQQNSKLYMDVS